MSSWLGLLHGLDFLLTTLLVGNVVFSFWIANPPGKYVTRILLLLLLMTSFAWFICLAAEMADSWKLDDLLRVAQNTTFGLVWIVKLFVIAILLATSFFPRLKSFVLAALILPLSFSLTGHASAQPRLNALLIALDNLHFLGASIWSGGLVCLATWIKGRLKEIGINAAEESYLVVRKFSRFAVASTATIAFSGLILSYLYGVRPNSLFDTEYSELVLLKTILFATTLSLASVNHFIYLRRWNPHAENKFLQSILRESVFELLLIFATLLVAGFLTRTPTP